MSFQYGLKEVLNLNIQDYTTNAELFYADYMSDSSIETTAERLDLRGGQGNYKILSFDHTKSMTFKGEMPLVDLNAIAMLSGKAIKIGTVNLPKRESLTVTAGNVITLAQPPITGTLKVYTLSGRDSGIEQTVGTPASTPNTYSIAGAVVTLNVTTAPVGSTFVAVYTYASPSTTTTTTFTADKFAGYVKISGVGVATDQVTGALVPVVFDIKKAKAKNNFSLTMKSSEATKLNMEFDLYAVDVSDGSGGIDKVYVTMSALT
jgi:hypothetical protein